MIHTILVALDGSPVQPEVLGAAAEVARKFGAKLVLFRAISVPPEFAATHADALTPHVVEATRAELTAAAAEHREIVAATRVDVSSQAARAILRASDELDVDLIVVGSHGRNWLDQLIGTTAARVCNLARRNVLVIHPRNAPSEQKPL